jgi:DNA-binding winged helix-turn-helix (wHTH) protein
VSKRHDTWWDRSGRWTADLVRREVRCDGAAVPLSGRAFEVSAYLLQAGDRVVSKDELIEHIWPGVVVEESTLQVHVLAIRRALGTSRATLETVVGRGYRLLPTWSPLIFSAPRVPAAAPGPRPKPLPLPTKQLIGRTAAIASLLPLLATHRIATLTGPGGIGKTALALTAARSLAAEAALVELAVLSNPALVAATAAQALGVEPAPEAIDPPRLLRV